MVDSLHVGSGLHVLLTLLILPFWTHFIETAGACWEEDQLCALNPPLSPRSHAHHFHSPPGLCPSRKHCYSRNYRNRPHCRTDHKTKTQMRQKRALLVACSLDKTLVPSPSLWGTKQGQGRQSSDTVPVNRSYRISPEPFQVTHAHSFLSQPNALAACLTWNTSPGLWS